MSEELIAVFTFIMIVYCHKNRPIDKILNNIPIMCLFFVEYATVGYMSKRLQMRKNRILALQKLVEQRKSTIADYGRSSTMYSRPSFCGSQYDCDHTPKQTVSVESQRNQLNSIDYVEFFQLVV